MFAKAGTAPITEVIAPSKRLNAPDTAPPAALPNPVISSAASADATPTSFMFWADYAVTNVRPLAGFNGLAGPTRTFNNCLSVFSEAAFSAITSPTPGMSIFTAMN